MCAGVHISSVMSNANVYSSQIAIAADIYQESSTVRLFANSVCAGVQLFFRAIADLCSRELFMRVVCERIFKNSHHFAAYVLNVFVVQLGIYGHLA